MDHPHDRTGLRQLAEADARLRETLAGLDSEALAAPSLLPGWSRAQVVAHLGRNAEGMARGLRGVLDGPPASMYLSQEQRDRDVDEDAALPREELLARAAAWQDELMPLLERLTPELHDAPIERVPGVGGFTAGGFLSARERELEVHHADLDTSYTYRDWPREFALRLVSHVVNDRGEGPSAVLRATDVDDSDPTGARGLWKIGSGAGPEITGTAAALGWWLTGRGAGEGLSSPSGEVPDLGRWR